MICSRDSISIRLLLLWFLVFVTFKSFSIQADSLKKEGGPVVIYEGDTIFHVFSSLGSYTPEERVHIIQNRLQHLSEEPTFVPDSLYITNSERTTDLMLGDQIILSVTDADARPLAKTRAVAASDVLVKLKSVLIRERESKGVISILLKVGLTILELLVLFLLVKYINKLFSFTKRWLISTRKKILTGIRFRGYELLDTERELQVALFLNSIVRWIVIILVLYLAVPILFSIFPWTRGLSDKLFGYILSPIKNIFWSVVNFIPNLFTIAVIYAVTRYAIKFVKFLADEIQKGALVVPGFYPDWALPTFNIVRVLMYAFMFIAVYGYLPGHDSSVFQGVSVFLGVLFSLGSSSAVSNMVAGLVITYMRPFKIGDRIKIGEITGDVVEKSLLVTRVRTIKNEDITIPNSTVLSGYTVNYTTASQDSSLILHTTVTIGYNVPWKRVHDLLIEAALATEGVSNDDQKKPFVLQTGLDDFYVSYQINIFTEFASRMAIIYSSLHQNIQDAFNKAGVEIMSPHYRAARDGNHTTIPTDHLPSNYSAPPFNVTVKKPGD